MQTGYDESYFEQVGEKLKSFGGFEVYLAKLTKGPDYPPNEPNKYEWMSLEDAKLNCFGDRQAFNGTMDDAAAKISAMSRCRLCSGFFGDYS